MRGGKVRSTNPRRYDREFLYLALPALGALAAEPTYVLVDTAIVGRGEVVVSYLKVSALGVPFAMIALAGQGYVRGIGNLRRPLVILVAANVVLEGLFVYGFGWEISGSAWGTVLA